VKPPDSRNKKREYLKDKFNELATNSKSKDVLYHHCFQLCFEHDIRRIEEIQVGLKLNGTHQLLAYADDMNLLGDNIDTINRNTTLIVVSKEVGLEVNVEKSKYIFSFVAYVGC
jgi:hypothetical protein